MLTRDLLRFRTVDSQVKPTWLKATPAIVTLAEDLIAYWRDGVGQRRGELEDGAAPILQRSRSLPVARGLQKLLLDRCTFTEAESCVELRERAFTASAAALRAPAVLASDHQGAIAAQVGLEASALAGGLYADLTDQAVLTTAPTLTVPALLAAYNLALAQGLILRARELTVTIRDADIGLRRRLLTALRWRRLLARIGGDDGSDLALVIGGPDAVLDQGTRYGLNLAQWLPALACAKDWSAHADIILERGQRPVKLSLSSADGLIGDTAFLGHVPSELRDLTTRLGELGWQFQDPQIIPAADGELIVPDLQATIDGTLVRIELFHRWHARALERRLRQVAAWPAARLLLGVERSVAKTTAIAPLLTQPAFSIRGFQFTELPTAHVLRTAVKKLLEQ